MHEKLNERQWNWMVGNGKPRACGDWDGNGIMPFLFEI